MRNWKRLLIVGLTVGLAMLLLALTVSSAVASGTCQWTGDNTISCSGTTEGRYVQPQWVPGHFEYGQYGGMYWVGGYYAQGYWDPSGVFYWYRCSHVGSNWSCMMTVPRYNEWTVPDLT